MGKVKIKRENEKLERYLTTTDDWYPNYAGNKVKVSILKSATNNFIRVAVWGADDTGMEYDVNTTDETIDDEFSSLKSNLYDKIPEPCTKKWFKKNGFVAS